jgi:hypothetical protein
MARRKSVTQMKLRYDTSQHFALKGALERTFGKKAWLDLKECTSVAKWKKYTSKLLRAMRIAIEETVRVRDDDWFEEICQHIEHGLKITEAAKEFDELLSALSATLVPLVFLQIGLVPHRTLNPKATLSRKDWRLDGFRTVQYVQTNEQLEAVFWSKQQRSLGVDRQMDLREKYRASKSKVPYSRWCAEQISGARTDGKTR